MPQGENFTRAHQMAAAQRPRTSRGNKNKSSANAKPSVDPLVSRISGETMEEASLRLQQARADTEELDRQKRELELARERGALVSKEEAVDLAQAAVLRVCQVLDLLPERLRDLGRPVTLDDVDDAIRAARAEIAKATA